MKVVIGADHGGFELKARLVAVLEIQGHEIIDIGAETFDPDDDYPDFSLAVAREVADGRGERGLIVCGSGVGAAIAANKVRGARACLCHDTYSARQGVEHDDMNILCLGGRVLGYALAEEVVAAFVNAEFSHGARHERRLQKILAAEREL